MNESIDQDLLAKMRAAVLSGDEATQAFLQSVSFTGMSLGLALVILQLENEPIGSLEGVLSLLREQRDQWRSAAEGMVEP